MEATPWVRSGLLRILLQVGRLSVLVSRVGTGDLERVSHSQPPGRRPTPKLLWHGHLPSFPSLPLFSSLFPSFFLFICMLFETRCYYIALAVLVFAM